MTDIPRWAFERMEREKARYFQVQPNPANVDVIMADPIGWRHYHLFAAFIAEHHRKPIDIIKDQLGRPVAREDGWVNPDHFDPWAAFEGTVYGSYSSEFDDMAILVLDNILNGRWGGDSGEGLAHEMFREMLCVANLCDYGTSPRGCFPSIEFREVLPALLEKWREYRLVAWAE